MSSRPTKRSRMHEVRGRLGWTQQQLADALGLDVRNVGRIERGEIPLRQLHVLALEALEARADSRPSLS